MTQTFDNWTAYDNWLIQNYDKYAMTAVNETEGKVTAEYMDKAEWETQQKAKEAQKEVAAKK